MNADRKPVALLSAPALGDGLLTLVLARNLHLQRRPSVLYSTPLVPLAAWFPWARIEPLPGPEGIRALFARGGPVFAGDPSLVPAGAGSGPGRLVFAKDRWDRRRSYLHSLQHHAERVFQLEWLTDDLGLEAPTEVPERTHPLRVALHPFSARPNKDWPIPQWLGLAACLEQGGWEPVVLLAPGEEERWAQAAGRGCATAVPGALDAVAAWLRGSGAAIAGDSGIGHLAAAVGLPTLSVFRKWSSARFWQPAWGRTAVVTAPWRLPGGRGHRHWGRLLSPQRVAQRFAHLTKVPAS